MKREVDDAAAALDALQADIAKGEADLAASETALRAAITSPLAVWVRPEITGLEGFPTIHALIRAPDGTLIAAGHRGGGRGAETLSCARRMVSTGRRLGRRRRRSGWLAGFMR